MAAFTNEEYADILMAYGKADGVARAEQRIYQERFPNRRLPTRNTFQNTYRRLRETGNVNVNEPRGIVVRHNVAVDERILAIMEEDPNKSIRDVAGQLEISIWKVWKVLRQNNMHAFHYTPVQDSLTNAAGYGTEWIYFPDENGVPHIVNLTIPESQLLLGQPKKIEYRLYSREISNYVILDKSGQPVNGINIGALLLNKNIKVVTHGWMGSADGPSMQGFKDAYLTLQNLVVIIVDWSDSAKNVLYNVAVCDTADVGSDVGQFLVNLCNLYNVPAARLHLIGHSLGSHVLGIAAAKFKSLFNQMIPRVTGLDPARPLIEGVKPTSRTLDPTDAEFVDVIHTCRGLLGYLKPLGHVDFFPNSGFPPQPGCATELDGFCSHDRSVSLLIESISNPTGFPSCESDNYQEYSTANQCQQQTYMGENVDQNAAGTYYLKTNPTAPYAKNT